MKIRDHTDLTRPLTRAVKARAEAATNSLFMKTTTAGVFSDRTAADAAITELKETGVATSDISCVYRDADGDIKDSEKGDKIGAGAAKGATTGAVVGAVAGLVVANGILPGIGTLFVAGPLAAALGLTGAVATTAAGAATGAVAGGLLGALVNLGIKKEDAELYETQVRSGGVLVVSHTETPGAAAVLTKHGASEVREYVAA